MSGEGIGIEMFREFDLYRALESAGYLDFKKSAEKYLEPILFEVEFEGSSHPEDLVEDMEADLYETAPRIAILHKLSELKDYYSKLANGYTPPEHISVDKYGDFLETIMLISNVFGGVYLTLQKLVKSEVDYKRDAVLTFISLLNSVHILFEDPEVNWPILVFTMNPFIDKEDMEQVMYVAERIQDALEDMGYTNIAFESVEFYENLYIGVSIF